MSKQKNAPKDQNKDNTSVLEKIRRRTGLLVGLVGLALAIFILESLLGSGASIFGNDEYTTVGHVNGRKMDRNEFLGKLEQQINNYRQRNKGREVDDQMRGQAVETVLQQYVVEYVMMPEFKKAGLQVGDDELYENVVVNPAPSVVQNLTDPNTGRINEQFSRPDGTLDPAKWRQAVQNVSGESEIAVRQMEDMVKNSLYFSKFRALVNKSLYITKAEAKRDFAKRNTVAEVSVVFKRYEDLGDSLVKITESDLEKYYKEHSYQFKNNDNSRRVEYVSFNVMPSPDDLAAIEKDAQRAAGEFKGKTLAEDSSFIPQESENGMLTIKEMNRKSMTIRDTGVYTAAPGTVFGPYNEGAYFKIYKLEAINIIADSARVRHILIGLNDPQSQQQKRSKPQAKREADSLLVLLKEGRANFDTLVKTVSDDGGSKANGGDYGWFDENEGFVEPFTNAGLKGVKGNISVVETQFGYHIIEVLEVSKAKHTSYKIAQISKPIAPSEETNQRVFSEASRFAGENNTAELFDKGVEKQKLTKRVAESVREGEYSLPGLDGAKELVRWAFTAKKGEVGIFSMPDKHVVAKLSGIRNKGVLPLEEVEAIVKDKVRQQKKGEMIVAEFQQKTGNSKNMDEIAKAMAKDLIRQREFRFDNENVDMVGPDPIIAGAIVGTPAGRISKPVTGMMGVARVSVASVNARPEPKDWKAQIAEMTTAITGRTDYDVYNALKDFSDIEFHRSRID